MIKSLVIVLFLFSFNFAFTQKSTCENRLDSIKVIKIANRHKMLIGFLKIVISQLLFLINKIALGQ